MENNEKRLVTSADRKKRGGLRGFLFGPPLSSTPLHKTVNISSENF